MTLNYLIFSFKESIIQFVIKTHHKKRRLKIMKKIIAMLMVAAMVFAFAACATTNDPAVDEPANDVVDTNDAADTEEVVADDVTVMSYDEFVEAAIDSAVTVDTYVQAKQGWWEKDGVGVATFYTQNEDGAFFVYEMPCSQEDYNDKLVTGAKIRVTGTKAEWSGEVEIVDATYELLEGEYIAEAKDLTDKLGTDELINYQNQFASFKGMTVEAVEYKNGEPGEDIYVTLGYDGASYNFCVESYLTGADTAVYTAVGNLNAGDVIDVEGFVYWYEGVNTHITAINYSAE